MPVDQGLLNSAIEEATGGDAELTALLREKFSKNDAAAAAFTGGFTRTRDYTQKTTALADDRKKIEGQLAQYQSQLESAEKEKDKVMRDLANHKVTVAQANARLAAVKETYNLSDEDIPPMGDLIETRKGGKVVDSTDDIDTRLDERFKAFEKTITDRIIPELGSMTELDIIWAAMADEHKELTGKFLNATERREILKTARESNKPLTTVWEEKYSIPTERKRVERDLWAKEERAKWDAEQTARRSAEAMEGIRPGAGDESGLRLSPVLKKQFPERGVDPIADTKPTDAQAGAHVRRMPSSNDRESLTGAERAAKRYLERRAAGIPMGGKEERKSA